MLGKRVKVKVGKDVYGEVINTAIPYLVTREFDDQYAINPVVESVSDEEAVKHQLARFLVNKRDVEIWED